MSGSNAVERFVYWLLRDRIPVVKLLILSNVVTFFLVALGNVVVIERLLAFDAGAPRVVPWTLVTYPLVGSRDGPISLLFAGYWLWFAGGSLERSWGTTRLAVYFFSMCVVSAVGLLAGSLVTGMPTGTTGLWLPLAGATIAFATLNPEEQILFFFLIPMKLKYLALLDVAVVLIAYGRGNPLIGVLALAGCAYSYWYVRYGRQYGRQRAPRRTEVVRVRRRGSILSRLNPFAWLRERRERKRLRDLFDR